MINMLLALLVAVSVAVPGLRSPAAADGARVPSVDDLLNLKTLGGAQVSPDGKWVAYTVTDTDWKQDAFVTQIWLAHVPPGRTFQLTRGDKSCAEPAVVARRRRGSAFTSAARGDKTPDLRHPPGRRRGDPADQGRERRRRLRLVAGRQARSPSRRATRRRRTSRRARTTWATSRSCAASTRHQHLWTVDVAEALNAPAAGNRADEGQGLHGRRRSPGRPTATRIAFSATINPDLIQGGTSDIYVLDLAERRREEDRRPARARQLARAGRPTAGSIVFSSAMGEPEVLPRATAGWPSCPRRAARRGRSPTRFDEKPDARRLERRTASTSARRRRRPSHLFRRRSGDAARSRG